MNTETPHIPADRPHRRGTTLIFTAMILVVLFAVASLATDWARVALARTELQLLVDAAARAAAAELKPGANDATRLSSASTKASQTFAYNKVMGQAVPFDAAAHLQYGRWDVPTGGFNLLNGAAATVNADCVRIRVTRDVQLLFGKVLSTVSGQSIGTVDVSASAVAHCKRAGMPYAVIALHGVNLNSGSCMIDSYNSAAGPYASTQSSNASVASNGNWNIQNAARVNGNLYYLNGHYPNGGIVSGTRTAMPSAVSYSASTIPPTAVNRGSHSGSSLTLAAGDYVYDEFLLQGHNTLTTTGGKVRIYIKGQLTLNGSTTVTGGVPSNLEFHNVSSAGVTMDFAGANQLHCLIFAPNSPVNINGSGSLYGGLVCKSLSMAGESRIHCDAAVLDGGKPTLRLMQ